MGFLQYEGADEIAKVLLPGAAPEARNLALLCGRSLGRRRELADVRASVELEALFQGFLDTLVTQLGRYEPYRLRLQQVAAARTKNPGSADENEFLGWLI